MNKHKIFGFVNMGAAVLMIISMFLPFIADSSVNFWKLGKESYGLIVGATSGRILLLLLSILVIVVYLINKKTKLSYITFGYAFFYFLAFAIDVKFKTLSVGFYFIMIASLTIGVLTFLYNEDEVTPIINLSLSVNKKSPQPVQPQPIQMQPKPSQQPIQEPSIVGYDPNTGVPIYSDQNK